LEQLAGTLADTINFETYALTRIKEAITDELQSIDGPTGTG
jgi:DNA-directed RNA polymerase specialized sigma subunit